MKHIERDPIVAIAGEWFTGHGKGVSLGYFGKLENAEIAGKLKQADFIVFDSTSRENLLREKNWDANLKKAYEIGKDLFA